MTTDLSPTIVPKSDQINADDLITGPRTITVTKVSLLTAADQPIAINYEGDDGKPYKPCKSMRRVMVSIWGPDGAKYTGRRMTLYRDPTVSFGGQQVGGIRISHMSDIDKPITMALTVTRANRKPYTVQPIASQKPTASAAAPATETRAKLTPQQMIDTVAAAPTVEVLDDFIARNAAAVDWLRDNKPEIHGRLMAAVGARRTELDMADMPTIDPEDPANVMAAG